MFITNLKLNLYNSKLRLFSNFDVTCELNGYTAMFHLAQEPFDMSNHFSLGPVWKVEKFPIPSVFL
jgi:hypothetical protein